MGSRAVYRQLVREERQFDVHPPTGWAMRTQWAQSQYGVSVAVPVDANMFRRNNEFVYETALWDHTANSLVYCTEAGYSDVQRFYTVDEVVAEVTRVMEYLDDHPDAEVSPNLP